MLSLFFNCTPTQKKPDIDRIWTAREFWQEGFEWYLDENKERVYAAIRGDAWWKRQYALDWPMIKIMIHHRHMMGDPCLLPDPELRSLLDRWAELQAEESHN